MDALIKLTPLHDDIVVYVLIDVVLVLLLLTLTKWLNGVLSKNNVTEELGVRDNFAFGISVAGSMLALCIVLSSAVGRYIGQGYEYAAFGTLVFGLVGIVLVKFGRFTYDKLVLNELDTKAMILERNVSIALVDAASLVASAVILRSTTLWVEGSDINAIIAVVTGFLVVQTVIIIATRLHERRFAKNNQDDSFQAALSKNHLALAIMHAGHLLGTAIIVSSAAFVLEYSPTAYVTNITGWLIVSVAMSILLTILVSLAKRIVLFGMDYRSEIDHQENVGVASVELTLSIGIALIISGVLA